MEEIFWVEKYRPRTINDTILPKELKETFKNFVATREFPNLILSGRAGIGKTTIAKAMLDELGCDYIVINASLNGNIDTLRNEIQQFVSTMSFAGGRKYVILDEFDSISSNSFQPALRAFIEEFSRNAGFIMTCNFPNKILEPIRSRCSIIDFKMPKDEVPTLVKEFYDRIVYILNTEGVEYDKKVLQTVIKNNYPDWRKIINDLQRYSHSGKIDSGILLNPASEVVKQLVSFMKEKNYTELRKHVGELNDLDPTQIYRTFYDTASKHMDKKSIPMLVLLIGKYQYQHAFVADAEINLIAFLTECMIECDFL